MTPPMPGATPLLLYGSGGHGREMLALIEAINSAQPTHTVVGWLDDRSNSRGEDLLGLPRLGALEELTSELRATARVVIAIGSSVARRRIAKRLAELGIEAETLIHPSAQLGPRVIVGQGCMIGAGAVLTSDITVGAHSIINIGTTVSHDCRLADYVTLAPGCNLAGGVTVREGADLGIGATVLPGREIGMWSTVGAASCITKPVPANSTVVGVPGRTIRTKPDGWHTL